MKFTDVVKEFDSMTPLVMIFADPRLDKVVIPRVQILHTSWIQMHLL